MPIPTVVACVTSRAHNALDKDGTRGSIHKRMPIVHRCIRTPNIVLSVGWWRVNSICDLQKAILRKDKIHVNDATALAHVYMLNGTVHEMYTRLGSRWTSAAWNTTTLRGNMLPRLMVVVD